MSKQFPHPFSAMASEFRRMRSALPREVSTIAANEFRANFKRQGLRTGGGVEKWKPRQENKGTQRAILIKTGRLRRAIRTAPTYDEARVVNQTPYAAIHNRGGDIKGKKRAWSSNLKTKLTRLRKSESGIQATMPARPFMVMTEPLMQDISEHVLGRLQRVFNAAKSA